MKGERRRNGGRKMNERGEEKGEGDEGDEGGRE